MLVMKLVVVKYVVALKRFSWCGVDDDDDDDDDNYYDDDAAGCRR